MQVTFEEDTYNDIRQAKCFKDEGVAVKIPNPKLLRQRTTRTSMLDVGTILDSESESAITWAPAGRKSIYEEDMSVELASQELKRAITIYLKAKKKRRADEASDCEYLSDTVGKPPAPRLPRIANCVAVVFRNISVHADVTQGVCCKKSTTTTTILNGISGSLMPYRLTAIMGASGAVLSKKLQRNVDGFVYYNQVNVTRDEALSCSRFVQQEDIFYPHLSAYEHLVAQARFRMPGAAREHHTSRVRELISQLGLQKVFASRIGNAIEGTPGLSGGERKRLSLASEMVTSPPVIFADEPTTGLDSGMAEVVIQKLKDLADRGHCVACTIHQPSSNLFQKFDDLILLADGHIVYAGDTMGVIPWFSEKFGLKCPRTANPADFIIRATGISDNLERQTKLDELARWASTWLDEGERFLERWYAGERDEFFDQMRKHFFDNALEMGATEDTMQLLEERWGRLMRDIIVEPATRDNSDDDDFEVKLDPEAVRGRVKRAGFWRQLQIMTSRCWKENMRNPATFTARVVQTVIAAVLMGMFVPGLTWGLVDSYTKVGCAQMLMMQQCMSNAMGLASVFAKDQPVVLREHEEQVANGGLFMFSKILADWPSQLMIPFLFNVIVYLMVRLDSVADFDTLVLTGCTLVLAANAALSMGYMSAAVAPSTEVAMGLTVTLIVPMLYFSGFARDLSTLPPFTQWLQYISVFKWGMIAYNKVLFKGEFVVTESGAIDGEKFLELLRIDVSEFWIALIVLGAMFIGFRILGVVVYGAVLNRRREASM
ncbi:MAG: hypothetical protein KVP17_003006 [Porospora cf. gigantea B]|uniref:uncharacterized protein n=1 Tax=Porospora cf. gigantea B TaxID=2853592 RepID=UPI003571855E|nr:MAG: hypothetical protein KVP17_003006 [Porospora cf. gigantea B]